jgi:uncharacterized protein with FMN-binding domain
MRRALPAVIATFIGLVALLSFKSSPGTPAKHIATSPIGNDSTPTSAPPDPATSTRPSGTTPTTKPPATNPPASAPPTSPPTTAGATRAVDGDAFDNRYGTVQVEVTLRGNRIVDVQPLQMPQDRERSAEISQEAAPLLQQEVLQAQSANIDIVGGATYTSESYAQSLQSALDKARG